MTDVQTPLSVLKAAREESLSFEFRQIAEMAEANIAKYSDPKAVFLLTRALVETNKLIVATNLNLSKLAKGMGL
jgi:hypothetical protein